MVTFDILGEMAFGESFHCVENEKHHAWIDLILNHLLEITLVDNLRRFSALATLGKWLLPSLTVAVRNQHSNDARRKVKLRLQGNNTRQDFLTNLVGKVKGGEVPEEELAAHASTLMYVSKQHNLCPPLFTSFLISYTRRLLFSPFPLLPSQLIVITHKIVSPAAKQLQPAS
jgi:hypothetical protein